MRWTEGRLLYSYLRKFQDPLAVTIPRIQPGFHHEDGPIKTFPDYARSVQLHKTLGLPTTTRLKPITVPRETPVPLWILVQITTFLLLEQAPPGQDNPGLGCEAGPAALRESGQESSAHRVVDPLERVRHREGL